MKFLIAGTTKNGYQYQRLLEEGQKRGHTVDVCTDSDIMLSLDPNLESTVHNHPISDYDLIRYQSISLNKIFWTTLIHEAVELGIPILDKLHLTQSSDTSIFVHARKLTEAHIRIPKTIITTSLESTIKVLKQFNQQCILRLPDSRKGIGVALVSKKKEVKKFFKKQRLEKDKVSLMVREYIPNNGDLRVLVIDGVVIGAMARHPKAGEFRANISQGGTGTRFDIEHNDHLVEIAKKATEIHKMDIAGVDIIINKNTGEPYVLEVNRSPQIEGFEKYTGINVAMSIIDLFEKRANQAR